MAVFFAEQAGNEELPIRGSSGANQELTSVNSYSWEVDTRPPIARFVGKAPEQYVAHRAVVLRLACTCVDVCVSCSFPGSIRLKLVYTSPSSMQYAALAATKSSALA